jgi:hypothetical protein
MIYKNLFLTWMNSFVTDFWFGGSTEVQAQDFVLGRQGLHHLSHASSPFIALVIFQTVSPALSWANLGP